MLIGRFCILLLVAATMVAPCIARAGSTSSRCGLLKADAAKIHARVNADNEIIQEEGRRRGHPTWCAIARDMISAADEVISIVTHDPAKCGMTDDRLEAIETGRTQMMAFSEGCP